MKWCHVVWPTYHRRELFKIPATARFCERALYHRCQARGWIMDTVFLATDQVHILMRGPRELSREAVVRGLQDVTGATLRRAGLVPRWDRKLWDDWAWCRILTNGPAVAAVRRWLAGRRAAQPGVWEWPWEPGHHGRELVVREDDNEPAWPGPRPGG